MADRTIRALRFSLAPHRIALAMTAGKLRPEVQHGGTGSPLRLTEIPRPARPNGWVRIAPILSGICASDRKYLAVDGMELTLTAFFGFPRGGVVLGHEIVGRVLEAPRESELREGDRVVAEPLLGCADKGFASCASCRAGDDHLCAHLADTGTAARGHGFGFDARFGGGWGEELVAPADRVRRVPDTLDDKSASLAEPFAVAAHAVLRTPPPPRGRVMVIGPGAIGLAVTHSLRTLYPEVAITVASLGPATDANALSAGADELVHGSKRTLVEAVAETLDQQPRGNLASGPVIEDGFDVVYDAVGSSQTIDDALRCVRPGGTVALIGTAGKQSVDWSLVWHRELAVRGSGFYATEDVPSGAAVPAGRRRAFDVALDILGERRPSALVTHVFELDEPVEAIGTAAAGPAAGAVRVAFAPGG